MMQRCEMKLACTVFLLVASMLTPDPASAKPEFLGFFLEEYPAVAGTRLEDCNVCHNTPPRRNPYGDDYNLAGRVFSAIESVDSDGDGVDNLDEILALTFPGDPADNPNVTPVATATPTPSPTATVVTGACAGDCDGDGMVAVNELVLAVNIALGSAGVGQCSAVDGNEDGQVTINELLTAVNHALGGCP